MESTTNKNLLIVFVKNIKLGKVKTRLAKSIGDDGAIEVYKHLVAITEQETKKTTNCDLHIYFSDVIIETKWEDHLKFVQCEGDLGIKMKNAFENGFRMGYKSIMGIGSDLPNLNAEIIDNGFEALEKVQSVFGPAEDGGYYLIGMNKLQSCIFENKPWSTENLLKISLEELELNNISYSLLEVLNDIDTVEDLKESILADKFKNYIN